MRWLVVAVVAACGGHGNAPPGDATGSDASRELIPVQTAAARITDVPVVVKGPGRTSATEKLDIRAPFDGTVTDLVVADGDHVDKNQVLGWIVAQESQAALAGARSMMRTAHTPREHANARRGLALARRWLVKKPLRAPEAAVVLSHSVDEGAHVSTNESIATLVPVSEIAFVAQIAQPDLKEIHPGEHVEIELASTRAPLVGNVHAILPGASPTDLTAPVRVDFGASVQPREVELFGTAQITVGHHDRALVVPAQAVVRDDVSGVSRVAVIDDHDRAHWVTVKTGLAKGDLLELTSAPFGAGTRVVVSGLAGLPEGAHVQVTRVQS